MVQAVNQVFQRPDSPFIYDQDIPFLPVSASPGGTSLFGSLVVKSNLRSLTGCKKRSKAGQQRRVPAK